MAAPKSDRPIHDQVRTLRFRYCHYIDGVELDALTGLFTPDAALVRNGDVVEGREEVAGWYEGTLVGKYEFTHHMVFNPMLSIDGEVGTGRWYYLAIVKPLDAPANWTLGRYHDEYRNGDDGWKFASITVEETATGRLG
jgi:hypothetical protein